MSSSPTKPAPPSVEAVKPWRGRMLVLASALLWSTSGFFGKSTHFDGWPGGLLAFWRAIFASAVIIPLVRKPAWSWWLVPMVICFVLMIWTYLTAMVNGLAATAIWLQSIAPVWVLVVGVLFCGEVFHRRDAILVFFGLAGVCVIVFFELAGADSTPQTRFAVACALASSGCYAAVVICLRRLRHMDSAWLAAVNHGTSVLFLLPYLYFYGAALWPQGIQWLYLAAFGALQIGLPYLMFARSLRDISGHEAGGIGLIEPVLVPVWAWLARGEQITPHVLAGAALIFVGLAWRYLGTKEPIVARGELEQPASS